MHSSRTASRSARSGIVTLVVLVGLGCSGTGSGCSTLTPFPAGTRYMGPKNDNAINIRLSAGGINYLNSNWQTLIQAFAPGGTLALPVGCMAQNIAVVGDLLIADQGAAGCNAESCGQMDGVCDGKDIPANVQVQLTGFSLAPRAPDLLDATIQLTINTGNLYVDTVDRSHGACVFLSPVKCSIQLQHRGRGAGGQPPQGDGEVLHRHPLRQAARLQRHRLLRHRSVRRQRRAGQAPVPRPGRPHASPAATTAVTCTAAWPTGIRSSSIVLQLISAPLQTQVRSAIAGQTCWPCMTNTDCPQTTDGNNTAVDLRHRQEGLHAGRAPACPASWASRAP